MAYGGAFVFIYYGFAKFRLAITAAIDYNIDNRGNAEFAYPLKIIKEKYLYVL